MLSHCITLLSASLGKQQLKAGLTVEDVAVAIRSAYLADPNDRLGELRAVRCAAPCTQVFCYTCWKISQRMHTCYDLCLKLLESAGGETFCEYRVVPPVPGACLVKNYEVFRSSADKTGWSLFKLQTQHRMIGRSFV